MPFFYDVKRNFTTNGSPNTLQTEIVGKTIANQAPMCVYAIYGACRFGTAGGAQLVAAVCTVTVATGGTAQTPSPKYPLFPAAASTWVDSTTAITAGGTLITKQTIGMAQTGGTGGWQALMPQDAIQMPANGVTFLDFEVATNAFTASVTGAATVEIGEGM